MCSFNPIYRNCIHCGVTLERGALRVCTAPAPANERVKALREARALIAQHAQITWKSGQIERSDGITDVLVDFDLKFPETRSE